MNAILEFLTGVALLSDAYASPRHHHFYDVQTDSSIDADNLASDYRAIGSDMKKTLTSSRLESAYRNSGSIAYR
jgi:hypothetical protein